MVARSGIASATPKAPLTCEGRPRTLRRTPTDPHATTADPHATTQKPETPQHHLTTHRSVKRATCGGADMTGFVALLAWPQGRSR